MKNEQRLDTLIKIAQTTSQALLDAQVQLTAVSTAFIGVLRALDDQPQLVALIAKQISAQAEKIGALYLGSSISDELLQRRTEALRGLLPPNLRALVTLQ